MTKRHDIHVVSEIGRLKGHTPEIPLGLSELNVDFLKNHYLEAAKELCDLQGETHDHASLIAEIWASTDVETVGWVMCAEQCSLDEALNLLQRKGTRGDGDENPTDVSQS